MYLRRVLSMVLAIVFMATTAACSTGSGKQTSGTGEESFVSGNSKELTMYVMDYDTTAQKAVEEFNSTHKDVQIKAKSLLSYPSDNLRSKLTYGLNNNNAPDILLCAKDTLPNLSVFFGKNCFFDLNLLINSDKSFKKEDYFQKLLDYGIYNGKRYVLPLSFRIDALFTTKDILDKSGAGINGANCTFDTFSEAASKYMSNAGTEEKYFTSALDLCNIVRTAAVPFYDLEKKTASFDSKEFIDLLNKYKSITGSICPTSITAKREDTINLLPEGKTVFLNSGTMNPRYASDSYSAFKAEIDPVIIPSPSGDKSTHVIAKPQNYIGISAKCGNVKAAYEFVKLMLSEQYQNIDVMEGIPVSSVAYEKAKENCLKKLKGYNTWQAGGCRNENTLQKIYSQQDSLIEKIDRFETTDVYINAIIKDKLAGFLDGSKTAEDTAKAIQQELQNYMKNGIMNPAWETRQSELNKPRTGKEIKIYYVFFQEYILKAVDEYKKKYQSEDVIAELQNDFTEMMKKTETELMAGAGPGLILFRKNYFNSTRKAISTGAFYPLDDMLKADSSYKPDNYYQKVLDAGVYDDKRYFIPLFFEYGSLETTKEALQRNNIKIDYSNWSWKQLHDIAMKFSKEHKGSYFFDTNFTFIRMIMHSGLDFVDYKNKTCNFDTPEFRELVGYYKDFLPLILPENQFSAPYILLKQRSCVMPCTQMGMANPSNMYCESFLTETQADESLVFVPNPSYSGEKHYYIRTIDSIGINSICKNKETAYNFIKVLLSDEIQNGVNDAGYAVAGADAPVNKKGYKISFDNWLHASLEKIPKESLYFVDNNADKFENPEIDDSAITNIIDESVKSYIDGKKSLDEAIKEINDKVGIFLNE